MLKTTNTWNDVQDNAVVYFTASWCQPCQQMKPKFAKAGMRDGSTNYYIIDVEELDNQDVITNLAIKSVPTIWTFSGEGEPLTIVKSRDSDQIIEEVHKAFA